MKQIFQNIVVLLSLFYSVAIAQDNHYWNLFTGNESAVLGGIVLDGVNDYSTSYFNPGNIAFLKSSGLGVTGNVYAYLNYNHENAAGEGNDFTKKKFSFLPNMGAGAAPFNKEDNSRIGYLFFARQSAALTMNNRVEELYDVIPTRSFNLNDQTVEYYKGDERYIGEINTDHQMTEYWAGISYGKKFSDNFGVGFTLFGSIRDQIKKYDLNIFAVDIENSLSATTDWNYMMDYLDFRILGKLGLVYKSESFNLGLTLTTPSIHLYGTGVIGGRVTSTGVYIGKIPNTNISRPFDYVASKRESDVVTNYISPLSIGIGLKKDIGSWRIRLAAEWFNKIPEHTLIQAEDPYFTITDPTNDSSRVVAEIPLLKIQQKGKSIINYGIALQKTFSEEFVAYLSFRTDFSNFEKSNENSFTVGETDDWDIYRFTTGGTYQFSRTIIGLGFQYSFSRDRNKISLSNLNPKQITENDLFLLNTTPTNSSIVFNEYKLILAFTYLFDSEL